MTKREAEVLRLLAQGHRNREIAEALCISSETVKTHIESICAKLGVRSRTEAASWWVQQETANELKNPPFGG